MMSLLADLIGRQFTERAQKRFGTYKVEGIHFTGPVKEELAYFKNTTARAHH